MEPTLRIFSGDEIKSRRHDLFEHLSSAVLSCLADGKWKDACDLTSAAIKTIQTADETSIKVEGEETRTDEFRELVEKAYSERETTNDQ